MLSLSFWGTTYIVFHSGHTIIHSQQRWLRVPFSGTLVISCLVDTAILTGMRHYLIAVLSCISLIANAVEYLSYICWPVVCLLGKGGLFRSSAHFLVGLFICLVFRCMSSWYILDINPLSELLFANIISHSVDCLFVLFSLCFAV